MSQYFFVTQEDTRTIKLYTRDKDIEAQQRVEFVEKSKNRKFKSKMPRSTKIHYNEHVYFPQKWETMTHKEIVQDRKNLSRRFLFWSLVNKSELGKIHMNDALSTFSLLKTMLYTCALSCVGGLVMNNWMKKLDPPIFDFFLFSNKKFQPKQFRMILVASILFGANFRTYKGIISSDSLFDTSLKYKQHFAPRELVSPNCEDIIQSIIDSDSESS